MIIKRVCITNFRSHSAYELVCTQQTTAIVGPNGCGKTSVIEAIYEAMVGKSFRSADVDILQRGADFYRVELEYENGDQTVVVYNDKKKRFLTGDRETARLPKNRGYPVVLFLPEDLHITATSPKNRRDFFDRMMGGVRVDYVDDLGKYNKTLKQRNVLLKKMSESEQFDEKILEPWDKMLAIYGAKVRERRKKFVEVLNSRLTDLYQSIAENEDEVRVVYTEMEGLRRAQNDTEELYLEEIKQRVPRDMMLGRTTYGVHLDKFDFLFNGADAQATASRGETRTLILALKFLEAELIDKVYRKKPVVLLDDVFSELDEGRQKCLVSNFKDNQVIITSVESVDV